MVKPFSVPLRRALSRTGFLGALSAAIVGAAFFPGIATFTALAQQPEATADLKDANGTRVGRAAFTQDLPGGGVLIHVEAERLKPGAHGIHIHTVGVCEGPAFTTAGGHFNPDNHKHGLANPQGPHAGDLPNLIATASGHARFDDANYRITLGEGPTSVFKPGGTALVIHADPDDDVSDPAGNSGPRIACGVITRSP